MEAGTNALLNPKNSCLVLYYCKKWENYSKFWENSAYFCIGKGAVFGHKYGLGKFIDGWGKKSPKQRIKCLAQRHNTVTPPSVRLELAAL